MRRQKLFAFCSPAHALLRLPTRRPRFALPPNGDGLFPAKAGPGVQASLQLLVLNPAGSPPLFRLPRHQVWGRALGLPALKDKLVSLQEMASDELRELRNAMTQEAIREHQMAKTGGTTTGLFQCKKCKKKNCTYNQVR